MYYVYGVKGCVYVGCEVCLYNLKICVNVIVKLKCVSLCVGFICMCMQEVSVYVQRGKFLTKV